jgi:hypothetical protein
MLINTLLRTGKHKFVHLEVEGKKATLNCAIPCFLYAGSGELEKVKVYVKGLPRKTNEGGSLGSWVRFASAVHVHQQRYIVHS